mmetsp:Transcript_153624/g.267726  ORF Transcript_153624/g.267726 Transcript_153624/m.267726 type:complete len:303 (-) Transcript_153624:159-1067(-)
MRQILLLCLASVGIVAAFHPAGSPGSIASNAAPRTAAKMETREDLRQLAFDLNPVVGFWDPLRLSEWEFADTWEGLRNEEARIGFLRHAEIKHGRVAMAAFVGYCVQANGVHWPYALTGSLDPAEPGIQFADISAAGSPPEQWDALPTAAKLQIILFVGFLEFMGENSAVLALSGESHYMKGGKPGFYPSLKAGAYSAVGNPDGEAGPVAPHPIPLDFVDPFGLQAGLSEEQKAKSLLAEINNGRLAMLGIMGFLAEQKVPGSVGLLSGIVKPYSGEVMAPFSEGDIGLPFVKEMLSINPIR